VRLILREAEITFDFSAERRAQQSTPIVPALLMQSHGHDAKAGEFVTQAQPVNHASRIRRHIDTRADLAQCARLLVDMHVEAGM
jgi:hypothetical protein